MKILHIASFNGNIGDNASHNGFRRKMSEVLKDDIYYTNLEMREFYRSWNKRKFDSNEFVELCNSHDLVVLGGGNYLEAKWNYSKTGTNFDISIEKVQQIHTPILFNSLGVDVIGSGSDEIVQRFLQFFRYILSEKRFFVGLRNDGSCEVVKKLLTSDEYKKVNHVYDNAFFLQRDKVINLPMNAGRKILGINIGKDMKDIRWNEEAISYLDFIEEMAQCIEEFVERFPEYDVIFFPHIYSDLEAINDVINQLNDIVRRTKIMVAPLVTGQRNENVILNLYATCDVVWAMRFHSSVCSIAQNVPTIALYCHDRIKNLYDSLQLEDRIVNVRETFKEVLLSQTMETISRKDAVVTRYIDINKMIENQGNEYFNKVKEWLLSLGVIE